MGQAIKNLKKTPEQQKHYVDEKRRAVEFNIGDEVLLSICNLSPMMRIGGSHKPRALYIEPFKIVKKFTSSYKLELLVQMKIHPIFQVSQLKLYRALEDSRQ